MNRLFLRFAIHKWIVFRRNFWWFVICELRNVDLIFKSFAICELWIVQSDGDGNVHQLRAHSQNEEIDISRVWSSACIFLPTRLLTRANVIISFNWNRLNWNKQNFKAFTCCPINIYLCMYWLIFALVTFQWPLNTISKKWKIMILKFSSESPALFLNAFNLRSSNTPCYHILQENGTDI